MSLVQGIRLSAIAAACALMFSVSGCTVLAVTDAVASTAVGVTKVAVKGTVAVVGAAIPDGDDKDK